MKSLHKNPVPSGDIGTLFDFSVSEDQAESTVQQPAVLLRALRYHESRLDAIVQLIARLESEVRQR